MAIISLENVTKTFGNRTILNNINFSVDECSIVTIMGESGAGKSTLLNILGLLDTPTSGKVTIYDMPVTNRYKRDLFRNRYLGFVFQSYNLIPRLTVYENIVLPIFYSQLPNKKEQINKVPNLIRRFNLESIRNSFVDHISGGEKHRVCLARALSCDVPILISDEPTGNLDHYNKQVVLEEFQKMNREGKTIIIVTHDTVVEDIATERFIISNGKVQRHG